MMGLLQVSICRPGMMQRMRRIQPARGGHPAQNNSQHRSHATRAHPGNPHLIYTFSSLRSRTLHLPLREAQCARSIDRLLAACFQPFTVNRTSLVKFTTKPYGTAVVGVTCSPPVHALAQTPRPTVLTCGVFRFSGATCTIAILVPEWECPTGGR